jgi:hypothetical protein
VPTPKNRLMPHVSSMATEPPMTLRMIGRVFCDREMTELVQPVKISPTSPTDTVTWIRSPSRQSSIDAGGNRKPAVNDTADANAACQGVVSSSLVHAVLGTQVGG